MTRATKPLLANYIIFNFRGHGRVKVHVSGSSWNLWIPIRLVVFPKLRHFRRFFLSLIPTETLNCRDDHCRKTNASPKLWKWCVEPNQPWCSGCRDHATKACPKASTSFGWNSTSLAAAVLTDRLNDHSQQQNGNGLKVTKVEVESAKNHWFCTSDLTKICFNPTFTLDIWFKVWVSLKTMDRNAIHQNVWGPSPWPGVRTSHTLQRTKCWTQIWCSN